MSNEVQELPALPALPGQVASPAKHQQLLKLAQSGTELSDMSKITGLPVPLIEASLEAAMLPDELKELIPDAVSYADLNLAIRAAKHKRALKHEDMATDIYATLLQKVQDILNQGGHMQLRTLLEGVRILQPQAARHSAAAEAQVQAAKIVNNTRTVNISLSGMARQASPVLDENGNILGIENGVDGEVMVLKNMDVNSLRMKAGTAHATRTVPAESMRKLLQQEVVQLIENPEDEDFTQRLLDLVPPGDDQ